MSAPNRDRTSTVLTVRKSEGKPTSTAQTVGTGAAIWRTASVLGLVARRSVGLGWQLLTSGPDPRTRAQRRDDWLVDTVTDLGPAFVKIAQLLSTRSDLLPPRYCHALRRLHDRVRPMPAVELPALLEQQLGSEIWRAIADQTARPVAAGSIACVYRATLPDGRDVAIKVRRPGIERVLELDLKILCWGAAVLAKTPMFRGVPTVEIVTQLADSIRGQLDLVRERESLDTLRSNVTKIPGTRVPQVYDDLCTQDVLVMEFIEGLHRCRPQDLSEADRTQAVISALRGVYRMLFLDGLVHCDLHPGNLYFQRDGSVVIVDAGFTVLLDREAQHKFTDFFQGMSEGDGAACADIVLSTAATTPRSDIAGFREEVRVLVEASSGALAAQFDLVDFATRLFDIQRRYGLYADPQFVFPILSLLVLEGAVRDFGPEVDFQEVAKPFIAMAQMYRKVNTVTFETYSHLEFQ